MTQKARSAPGDDPTRSEPQGEEPRAVHPEARDYYLLNPNQAGDLEEFRFALLALADLSWDIGESKPEAVTVDRMYHRALFNQLEKRLRDIAPPQRMGSIWLDPAQRAHAFRNAEPLRPDQQTPLY